MSPDDRDETSPAVPYATTEPGGAPTAEDTIIPGAAGGAVVLPEPGYQLGELIGRGGMGEVVSAHDRRIGRDVAIKRMRSTTPSTESIDRFLREARVQARLDHPAIVPVHELGVDLDGRPYFTMKRLAGVTLAQRLAEPGPIQPLLRAFAEVCLAIEFAHARGVVHRDLKPANIMLGDYGEVYVLDWGVARVLADRTRAASAPGDIDSLGDGTRTGDLLGTPGYMAPEQLRGEDIGPAVDVYALGSILFEILAGEPLHPRGTAALTSTLSSPQQAPSRRGPDRAIAPELDAACEAALAEVPTARPTARELGERVQRYLDGDRDVERRRALAVELLAQARAAHASGDPEARAVAMNRAGRALGLDPESTEAAELVSSLIVEPPPVLPAALVAELAEEDRRAGTERLRSSLYALFGIMSVAVVIPLMQISNWTTLGLCFGVLAGAAVVVGVGYVRGKPNPITSLLVGFALAVAFSRVLGPFVLTPVAIIGSIIAISGNRWVFSRPGVVGAWLLAVTAAPLILEWTGVFAPTWWMIGGGVCSRSAFMTGRGTLDAVELICSNLIMLATTTGYVVRVNRAMAEANHKVHTQAWHLEQMLPAGRRSARGVSPSTSPAR